MSGLNKVLIIGNLGKDAEMKYAANGTVISTFSVAVNSRKRGAGGDWEDETEWFNVTLFGGQAERLSQYLTKGKQVYVEGRLQTRSWEGDDGVKRYHTGVIANSVQLLGSKQPTGQSAGSRNDWGDSVGTDDLPF